MKEKAFEAIVATCQLPDGVTRDLVLRAIAAALISESPPPLVLNPEKGKAHAPAHAH